MQHRSFESCTSWIYVPQEDQITAMLEMLSSRLQMSIRLTTLEETEIIRIVLCPLAKCHPVIQFCLFKISLFLPPSLTQTLSLILHLDHCVVDHCLALFGTPQKKLYLFDGKIVGSDLWEVCL